MGLSVRSNRVRRQNGIGLVEVLVASALMAVALVVLLGSLSSLLLGARVAERRTVEERLARAQIEKLMAYPVDCPTTITTPSEPIDRVTYQVETAAVCASGYEEFMVTVRDQPSGPGLSLSNDLVRP